MQQARNPRARGRRSDGAPKKIYRKRPVQARSRSTVDVILSAAARILARTGYDRFTTNHVARLAGVSIGSLYQYFPSKEALVAALLDRHVDGSGERIRKRLRQLARRPAFEDVLRCYAEAMVDAHRDDPQLHRVFVEQLPRSGTFVAKTEQRMQQAVAMMRAFLTEHSDRVGPQNHELNAFLIVHAVDALTHAAVVARPDLLRGPELSDAIGRMIVSYLQSETGTRT